MIGTTALHTRAACDECGDVPATREARGGIIVCERCDTNAPANDDALGSLVCGMISATPQPRLPCSRCSGPAFVRVTATVILCAGCWLEVAAHVENESSFADRQASSGGIAAATEIAPPNPPVVAAANSQVPGGWSPPDRQTVAEAPIHGLEFTAAVTNSSSCGDVKESSASIPEYNGVKSPALLTAHGLSGKSCPLSRSEIGPQDSIATGNNPTPTDVLGGEVAGRDSIADAGACGFDLDAIVSDLEAGWARDRRNSATSRSTL